MKKKKYSQVKIDVRTTHKMIILPGHKGAVPVSQQTEELSVKVLTKVY